MYTRMRRRSTRSIEEMSPFVSCSIGRIIGNLIVNYLAFGTVCSVCMVRCYVYMWCGMVWYRRYAVHSNRHTRRYMKHVPIHSNIKLCLRDSGMRVLDSVQLDDNYYLSVRLIGLFEWIFPSCCCGMEYFIPQRCQRNMAQVDKSLCIRHQIYVYYLNLLMFEIVTVNVSSVFVY